MGFMLQIEGVSISFGGIKALSQVSLNVEEGRIFGLLGPNGAGKTTLFNAIAGVYPVDSGKMRFNGQDITAFSTPQRCRMGIARTFQITQPFAKLTVAENIMVGASLHTSSLRRMREVAGEYAELVGLGAKLNSLGSELSTGQRKRLEMARAMATQPKLLLLDEVTGGVDHASIGGLIELVAKLRADGVTIVLIEHNMDVLTTLSDQVLFMVRGEALATGDAQRVMQDERVVSLYLGEVSA
jgi:branched-chain amino acid transport system ATP-binding protein